MIFIMKKRAHVIISGCVQGVWFRVNTRDKAEQLGLTGWVKNTYNGNVEAIFEGDEEIINEVIAWCHKGPSLANVSNVKVDFIDYTGEFQGFSIKY